MVAPTSSRQTDANQYSRFFSLRAAFKGNECGDWRNCTSENIQGRQQEKLVVAPMSSRLTLIGVAHVILLSGGGRINRVFRCVVARTSCEYIMIFLVVVDDGC